MARRACSARRADLPPHECFLKKNHVDRRDGFVLNQRTSRPSKWGRVAPPARPRKRRGRSAPRPSRLWWRCAWKRDGRSFETALPHFFARPQSLHDRNQVDPACSHTLVSKIKPCMFKHKYHKAKLRMAHYISYNILDSFSTWITVVILELIHDQRRARAAFIRYNQPSGPWRVIITELTVFVRRFLLISALSAFDGRVLAYHGVNG